MKKQKRWWYGPTLSSSLEISYIWEHSTGLSHHAPLHLLRLCHTWTSNLSLSVCLWVRIGCTDWLTDFAYLATSSGGMVDTTRQWKGVICVAAAAADLQTGISTQFLLSLCDWRTLMARLTAHVLCMCGWPTHVHPHMHCADSLVAGVQCCFTC